MITFYYDYFYFSSISSVKQFLVISLPRFGGQNVGVSEALIGLPLAEFLLVLNSGGEGSRRL
jgi:hypothetical protein